MDDIIRRFRDYQIKWLTTHNDIEFCEEEEKLIIGFLKDSAESFVRENQMKHRDIETLIEDYKLQEQYVKHLEQDKENMKKIINILCDTISQLI